MSPVTATPPEQLKRQYPHVDTIEDWRAQQSIRLLWDRVFDLEARLQAAESTQGDLVSTANAQENDLAEVRRAAGEALAIAQTTRTEKQQIVDEEGPLPGGGDGGEGEAGCNEADGSSSHGTPSGLTAREAGKIVCGVGFEFPSLLAPVADDVARQDQAEEFVLRAIWHLQQAGFTAGRQQNPSGLLSKDKLAVIVDGITRVYDVLTLNDFSVAMDTQMVEVPAPNLVPDPGTPD